MKAHLFGSAATVGIVALLLEPRLALAQTAAGGTSSPAPAPIDAAAPGTASESRPQPPSTAEPIQNDRAVPSPTSSGLEDIVVTAQRRAENLQRAAIAVTAVSGDSLIRAGVTDSSQLTRLVPALQISNVSGPINAFYLRGVGNFVVNSLSDPAIAFNVDGVNFARPTSSQGVFYDLERVEVLKGPQGTLYGRNATGGAINVITVKPKLSEFSGYGNFEYGNYDSKKVTAAINIPFGDNNALRVAGQYVDRDGTYSDGTGDDKRKAIRATFASQVTSGFKLTVSADYEHQGGVGPGATVVGLNKDDRIGLFDPRAEAIITRSFSFGLGGNTLNALVPDYYNRNNFWGVYAQADVTTPVGTLTVLPAFRRSTLDYRSYAGGFAFTNQEVNKQASVEVRLASDGTGPLSYILGGFYMHETTSTHVNYDQQYYSAYAVFHPVTDSYAGFARLTYRLFDKLRLTGGIRYTIDAKQADLRSLNAVAICPTGSCPGTPAFPDTVAVPAFLAGADGTGVPFQPYGPGGAFANSSLSTLNASKTFKKPTYRAGLEYDVAPASMVYATFETGFKSGGFYSSIDTPTFNPETINAFTLGSKNRFLDNRLQLNIEAYRWTYKGQQIAHFRNNSQGGSEFVTENIGTTRLQGVEVEAQARVFKATTLNATAQYLDAKYVSFRYGNSASVGPPVTGCIVSGPVDAQFTVDCSGRRPSQAPEWTLSGGIEQRIPLGNAGNLTFTAQTRYQSGTYTGFELLAAEYQRAYSMTDLELIYAPSGARFTIAAFANNVGNANVTAFSQPHPQAPSLVVENLRDPRLYGVRLGAKF
ncbi:TonB-dependent receptor [Sphingomonas bacterium]|uniref:TonB-dependent receptor n=1 Tax=Sphingomonas bacterium TaxID=1895847 RepID=UPI001576D8AC|nr:TonB-dependent receptor [Sphingomonas bacterium]